MAGPSSTVDQNLLPVQAYFDVYGNFQTFIGQGQPFYATVNPVQSGLTITSSTINSTTIGALVPSTGVFTNISTATGQISTSPSAATDIVNKLYVDTVAQGLNPKAACKAGTLTNITLSGLQTIDGYSVLAGNRVLVKNQTATADNGIYVASASAWTRATDMDVWAEVPGAYTVVLNGSQANTAWVSTSADTGTIGVTPITFVQFSGVSTYYAGTGLTLASNTFSITPVGTANTYGSASAVPVFTTNASGQITAVTNTTIAIANTQVSGLGTMSTQNANAVAITGGSIDGTTVGLTTATTVRGTTITATSQFSGPGTGLTGTATSLSIGGNAATATSSGSVTNSVTFNSGGAGGVSPITYNGSVAQTISYNTIGAPSTTGSGASGTWGIAISGNAATVTNGLYSTGSYSNPTWLTSISGSIVSGAVASATLAASATNIAGGTAGALAYQTGAGATTFLSLGTTNYVLTAGATAPQYVAQSTLSVGSATNATNATYLAGGVAGSIPWQSAVGVTGFTALGTTGQVLTSNGTSTPTWTTPTSYATVTDDTTTNATRYPLFANQTTGNLTTEYTSSTKYQFNPFTGLLTATGFSGSGANLTSLPAGQLSGTIPSGVLGNSTLYIGTTAVVLNAASGSITSLAVNISGSAGSAGTATTATNANNVAVTDNTSSVATWYPTLVSTTTGNLPITTSSTKISFVPNTGILTATGFSGPHNGTVGSTTASTGAFTTLSASSTVSGTGFSTYLASPPAIGGTDAAAVTGSNLMSSGGVWAKGLYAGTTYTDGLVIDYVSPTARFSAGTSDGFAWYNGGVGTTALMTLSSAGAIGTATWNGTTVGVSYGGTGTSTAFTAGSIVYAGASGVYSQDNANFFWDATNHRLGVGTTSPIGRIQSDLNTASTVTNTLTLNNNAGGSGNGAAINFYNSGTSQPFTGRINSLDDGNYGYHMVFSYKPGGSLGAAALTEGIRLFSSGGVSIGNTTDAGASNLFVSGNIYTGTFSTNPITNRVNGNIFNGVGGLTIRAPSNYSAWGLSATSGSHVNFYTDPGSGYVAAGNISSSGSVTTYNVTSDYRLKNNIQKLKNSGNFVDALNPVTFTWETDGRNDAGFLAHEFQTVSPNSVIGTKDEKDEKGKPVYQSMQASTSEVMANIIAELQSLRARLKAANL